MSLEQILEKAAHARPGYELATFKEAGLPIYVLTLRILTLERKPLGPIEEGVLRAVQAGLDIFDDIVSFLGLSANVLTPVLAGLMTNELINYSRAANEPAARVSLTAKGRLTLAELGGKRPQERTVRVCFDALTRRLLLISPEQLYKPRDMKELGYFEIPKGDAKRPEVEDIPLQEFDRVLQQQRAGLDDKAELLGVRRVERRELHFQGCVMVFYRRQANRAEIDVAFWREDGPALEHETCFRALGGPDLVGAKLLTAQAIDADVEPTAVEASSAALEDSAGGASRGVESTQEAPKESRPTIPDGETVQSVLCHEHPGLLKKALFNSQKRLLIISPWIRHHVVNREFVASLGALLRKGVVVHIGYGLNDGEAAARGNAAASKPPITPQAEKDLRQLDDKYPNFHLVYVGNTHRKILVSDDTFAVTTSFNWLSFKGDPRERPRDEYGEVFRKKAHVDKRYELGLALLEKGYAGAGAGPSAGRGS